jgi:hypothetical protein
MMCQKDEKGSAYDDPLTTDENLLHQPGTLARFVQVARNLKLTAPEVEERMRFARLRFLEVNE